MNKNEWKSSFLSSTKSENFEDSIFETQSNVASVASCFAEILQWVSLIELLPSYYEGELVLERKVQTKNILL